MIVIKEKDRKFVLKIWKKGSFRSYDYFGISDTLERLMKLGVIEKDDRMNYKINRGRWIEIQDEEFKNQLKQKTLF